MESNIIASIINTLKDAILGKLGDEVDLIFQYGSYVKGEAHNYSDVDISYVPVHETTWESITVMVDETLFDFYPLSWSRLERMAEFRDVSSTVLLYNQVIYQRNEAAAAHFDLLARRLRILQQPEFQPEMLRRAMEIYQGVGYDYYLLRLQAEAGHLAGCLKQAQAIFRMILHCLAVCNQACIDTRKMAQVLALPKLPAGFAGTVQRITIAFEPHEILSGIEHLLQTTRDLLVLEQHQFLRGETTFPAVFDSGYPELKRDLQAVMMACKRRDIFSLKRSLLSLLHEMSRGIAQVSTGVQYSGFNALTEYEQDLVTLGFPALLPPFAVGDFDEVHRRCTLFDQHLKTFLAEKSVKLNNFDSLDELKRYLSI